MKKSYLFGAVIITIGLVWLLNRPSNVTSPNGLTSVSTFHHAHGLAVDSGSPSKLYIATHNGLFLLEDDQRLYRVGEAVDDYMGFSPHPTDPNILYTSGHPASGGNLGFQKSTDAAKSWQKLSNGAGVAPVDFHAMAVSAVDPNLIYGWYNGLQKSADGGSTWQATPSNLTQVIALAADTQERGTVYAATATGLLVSKDQGATWESLARDLSGVVSAIAINPASNQELLAYSQKLGLATSSDGGKTWQKVETSFADQIVLHIAYSRHDPKIIYTLTESNSLYKTSDSGKTWTKIR